MLCVVSMSTALSCSARHPYQPFSTPTSPSHAPLLPTPQPTDVKKRVESLIDREYLERDDGDLNVYKYLA